jgi:hypothetical protein
MAKYTHIEKYHREVRKKLLGERYHQIPHFGVPPVGRHYTHLTWEEAVKIYKEDMDEEKEGKINFAPVGFLNWVGSLIGLTTLIETKKALQQSLEGLKERAIKENWERALNWFGPGVIERTDAVINLGLSGGYGEGDIVFPAEHITQSGAGRTEKSPSNEINTSKNDDNTSKVSDESAPKYEFEPDIVQRSDGEPPDLSRYPGMIITANLKNKKEESPSNEIYTSEQPVAKEEVPPIFYEPDYPNPDEGLPSNHINTYEEPLAETEGESNKIAQEMQTQADIAMEASHEAKAAALDAAFNGEDAFLASLKVAEEVLEEYDRDLDEDLPSTEINTFEEPVTEDDVPSIFYEPDDIPSSDIDTDPDGNLPPNHINTSEEPVVEDDVPPINCEPEFIPDQYSDAVNNSGAPVGEMPEYGEHRNQDENDGGQQGDGQQLVDPPIFYDPGS